MTSQTIISEKMNILEEKISTLENDLKEVSEKIRVSKGEERMIYLEEEKKLLSTGIKILRELAKC